MEWISVKDRLPEDQDLCLIYINRPENENGHKFVMIERYYSGNEYGERWGTHDMPHVTHWMLLPSAPEEER